ncbi:unnamed protein product [Sphagnum balticum]
MPNSKRTCVSHVSTISMHALNLSVVAKLGAQQPHTRIHLLAAAPMMYAQSTARNLATLARGALIVFGVPLQKVVTSVTDGAANVRAVCLSHIVLFLYTLFTAQMQRDLGICGRWCAAHRANLVASVGLARLTQLPPPKQRRAKYTYASDPNIARWHSNSYFWLSVVRHYRLIEKAWAISAFGDAPMIKLDDLRCLIAAFTPLDVITELVSMRVVCAKIFFLQSGAEYVTIFDESPLTEQCRRDMANVRAKMDQLDLHPPDAHYGMRCG